MGRSRLQKRRKRIKFKRGDTVIFPWPTESIYSTPDSSNTFPNKAFIFVENRKRSRYFFVVEDKELVWKMFGCYSDILKTTRMILLEKVMSTLILEKELIEKKIITETGINE